MSDDDTQLIQELGIGHLNAEQQENILDEFHTQVGEILSENLSEAQLDEYESIINGDDAVIEAWLAANAPDYKNTPLYEEIEAGYDTDPDKVPAEKVIAYLGWVELNNPGIDEAIVTVKANIQSIIDQYT